MASTFQILCRPNPPSSDPPKNPLYRFYFSFFFLAQKQRTSQESKSWKGKNSIKLCVWYELKNESQWFTRKKRTNELTRWWSIAFPLMHNQPLCFSSAVAKKIVRRSWSALCLLAMLYMNYGSRFFNRKTSDEGKLRKICSLSLEKKSERQEKRKRNFAMQINDNFISLWRQPKILFYFFISLALPGVKKNFSI